jgi:hypothetical protein
MRATSTEGTSLQSILPASNRGSVMVLATIINNAVLLVALLYFMQELLLGSTLTVWIIRCIPWYISYFWSIMQFSKVKHATILWARTVESWFEEHRGECLHHLWPPKSRLQYSGLVWRLEWGTNCHLKHLSSSLNTFFTNNGITF